MSDATTSDAEGGAAMSAAPPEDEWDAQPAAQMEFNMGGPGFAAEGESCGAAMDAALETAVHAFGAAGAAPSPEVIAEARKKAAKMLTSSSSDAGPAALQQRALLYMGVHAACKVFHAMVAAAGLGGGAEARARAAIQAFTPPTEEGCLQVNFYNRGTRRGDVAYLVLGECPGDHDLGRQLDKLKAHVLEDKWAEVLQSISLLVRTGITVYGQLARKHASLIRDILGADAQYLDLKVDATNTTLYLDKGWPARIGVFIWLKDDFRDGAAQKN